MNNASIFSAKMVGSSRSIIEPPTCLDKRDNKTTLRKLGGGVRALPLTDRRFVLPYFSHKIIQVTVRQSNMTALMHTILAQKIEGLIHCLDFDAIVAKHVVLALAF